MEGREGRRGARRGGGVEKAEADGTGRVALFWLRPKEKSEGHDDGA
jgi:hypothetical protein